MTAGEFTSAGRFWPWGPLVIGVLATDYRAHISVPIVTVRQVDGSDEVSDIRDRLRTVNCVMLVAVKGDLQKRSQKIVVRACQAPTRLCSYYHEPSMLSAKHSREIGAARANVNGGLPAPRRVNSFAPCATSTP
jgi:hypothetical protein